MRTRPASTRRLARLMLAASAAAWLALAGAGALGASPRQPDAPAA